MITLALIAILAVKVGMPAWFYIIIVAAAGIKAIHTILCFFHAMDEAITEAATETARRESAKISLEKIKRMMK